MRKPPNLSRLLTLEAPVRVADGGGGWGEGWTELGQLWAEVSPVSAREPAIGDRPTSQVTHRIVVRSAPVGSPRRPAANQRFRSGERTFAIRGVAELGGRDAYLLCWAVEGGLE